MLFYLLADMGQNDRGLALRATTSCFSDPKRREHAAILYTAPSSAKLTDLDGQPGSPM